MLALRELEAAMAGALLGGEESEIAREIAGDGLAPSARLAIYRHHVLATLTAALEATYPVVCRLVDRRFFAYAADCYIRAHPPDRPCLQEYGASFADFLREFPACRALPYLADVARLEWAMNAAWHAADVDVAASIGLEAVPADAIARIRLSFEPSVSFVRSPWPVDRIWRAHKDGAGDEIVDVASGGAQLEVRRLDGDVVMRALDGATFALRSTLAGGGTLGAAAEAALAADPAFDLATGLRALLDDRIAVAFTVSD